MHSYMKKPRVLPMKILVARIIDLNNCLLLFPLSNNSKKMYEEDINKILLHAAPNGLAKQAHTPVWDF